MCCVQICVQCTILCVKCAKKQCNIKLGISSYTLFFTIDTLELKNIKD